MGFADEIFHWSDEELRERVVSAIELNGRSVSPEPFRTGGLHAYDFGSEGAPVQFANVLPATADGKIHLTPACLGPDPYRYQPILPEQFPLALVTPASAKLVSSTFGEFNLKELSGNRSTTASPTAIGFPATRL
jgi:hypothetical protein